MSKRNEPVTISYDEQCIFRETEKAWCICYGETRSDRDRNLHFIPKSVSTINKDAKEITMPRWMVEEQDLEDYAV